MRKIIPLAAILALTSFAAVPSVNAQTLTGSSAIVMSDHSMRAAKLIGLTVTDDHGEKLGKIVDVLVKGEAAEPTVILSTGKKMVAMPVSHLTITGAKVTMSDTTPAMIMAMAPYYFVSGGG